VSPIDLGHHGDRETEPGLVDFAVNVAVQTPPPWLLLELERALAGVARYPDVVPAVEALARLHACPPACVLVTNGAAEAFTLIARARPWRKPLVVHPQFTEPESALAANGHDVARLVLRQENDFALDPALVPGDADLVVVGNPTNPTSRLHRREVILALLRPGRLVVVDEAFMDVVAGGSESVLGNAAETDGLLVVRSLTKTFALAGVRAGYLVGGEEVIAECALVQPHWSVNSLAVTATVACAGPKGQDHLRVVRQDTTSRLSYLVAGLGDVGLEVAGQPAGPFVLVHHRRAAKLREGLRRRGLAVRRGDTFPGLGSHWLRIAAREPAMTDLLLAALAKELAVLEADGQGGDDSENRDNTAPQKAPRDGHESAGAVGSP
jgi:histidinol-phosphate/aromatic aminotransferase/cobyric acid decarboxylase-like protein